MEKRKVSEESRQAVGEELVRGEGRRGREREDGGGGETRRGQCKNSLSNKLEARV